MSANDRQEGGSHYKTLDPEPWDVIEAWELNYLLGNALKYIARAEACGGKADLLKARHYLDKQIERWEMVTPTAGVTITSTWVCTECGAAEGEAHAPACKVAGYFGDGTPMEPSPFTLTGVYGTCIECGARNGQAHEPGCPLRPGWHQPGSPGWHNAWQHCPSCGVIEGGEHEWTCSTLAGDDEVGERV